MSDAKVDLNQASASELAALPGIGQKLAEKIVAYRQENDYFSEAADLVAVPGISDQMVGDLEERLVVAKPDEAQATTDDSGGSKAKEKAEVEEKSEAAEKKPAAKKASPTKQKKTGGTEQQLPALRAAARSGDAKKVAGLIKKGADGHDKFALLWAAEEGHAGVVAELIAAGVDVNSKSAAGGPNALSLAAQNGHLEVVQTLVAAGADVNEPAMQGWTPLMKAAYFGHDRIVQSLLEAGAEIRVRDMFGRTAADHAQRADNPQLANLLVR